MSLSLKHRFSVMLLDPSPTAVSQDIMEQYLLMVKLALVKLILFKALV